MREKFLLLLAFAFIFTIANAQANTLFKLNDAADFKLPCVNNNTYCSVSAVCNVTVLYPNSTIFINNKPMQNQTSFFNYSFITNQLSTVGNYAYTQVCNDGANIYASSSFTVTPNGKASATDFMQVFIYLMFILASIGIFCTLILTIVKLAVAEETIFGVLITWSFYILLLIANFLSGYLTDTFILDTSNFIISIASWTNGVLPIIALVVSIFVKSIQKKKPLSVQEMTGRRVFYG